MSSNRSPALALGAQRASVWALLVLLLAASPVWAQNSFSLDDNPFAPLIGPPGLGFGAENPFGMPAPGYPPGLAPSPTLPFIVGGPGLGDGAILLPSAAPGVTPPILEHPGPDGFYLASLSSNKTAVSQQRMPVLPLNFSVDRPSIGAPGTAVAAQAVLNQAPGDIYVTTTSFVHPGVFAGTLAPGGFALPTYAGFLPAVGPGILGNALDINQGLPGPGVLGFGLGAGGPAPGPTVLPSFALAPPIGPGTHDNVDAYDRAVFNVGTPPFELDTYFSVYPAAAIPPAVSSASIFLAPVGAAIAPIVPWAPSFTLGLDTLGVHPVVGTPFSDCVDALVVWDNGIVGMLEPGIDYALFSLSPGSTSLLPMAGLINDADVFFTDFTGLFATYAPAGALGLIGDPTGGFGPRTLPLFGAEIIADGLDALEIVPEPSTITLAAFAAVAVLYLIARRRVRLSSRQT